MRELISGKYVNAAGTRTYKLYVAASRSNEAPPLFVMLHGCDQDAADFSVGTRMNALAEECGGVVLYPEQCRLVNPFGCWNWHDAKHQFADAGEPSLIAGMTLQVVAERHIDPARVYVAGMSAGGAMAVIVAQEYPGIYAAVGVHSGVPSGVASDLLSALRAMRGGSAPINGSAIARQLDRRDVPTIVFHGDRDTVIHPSNGNALHHQARRKQQRSMAAASRASRSSKTHAAEGSGRRGFTHTTEVADGLSRTELWMVHGAGHAWTGGNPDGTYTDAAGPDASREMMRFFLQQRLDADRLRH
jgi:poly(hydroxyalkanoate) depolymerase family esterase